MTLSHEIKTTLIALGLGLAFGLMVGLFIGYSAYYKPPVLEKYAPAVRQHDGSLVLEKKPDAKPIPKQEIPKGSKVERVVSVTVRPTPRDGIGRPDASKAAETCPDVTVDLTLVKNADDTRSVIASSPDGEVIAGVDIPRELLPKESSPPKWAIGGMYYSNRGYAARIERDLGPLRIGADVLKTGNDLVAGVGIMIRF
jgi:hypothetical protein